MPQDYATAAAWYRKAALQGNAQAKFRLGLMYEKGTGVSRDAGQAMQWYRKAAEQDLAIAQKALSRMESNPAATVEFLESNHRGVTLIAVPPLPGVKFDGKLVSPSQGLDNLRKALDLIHRESPYSTNVIESLKKNGNVFIVYNPHLPGTIRGSIVAAVFLPDYFKKDAGEAGGKDFVVVVSLNGIKWPTPELAGVFVHELVGHGMQKLLGRMDYIRELDLECAANLYKEKFNQDIGIDKKTKEVIESRQALEEQWCSDFKRHMRQHTPSLMNLWDVLNPDVPRLLEVFNDYVNDLRAKGVSGKAIEAANELKKTDFEMWIGKVTERSSADEQLQVGYSYRDGVGTTQDFAEAAKWFRKAALQGSAAGQNLLGNMYLQGQGVPEDHIESAKWYRKAALQGDAKAQFNLGFMYRMSQGVPQDHVESARWNRKAAEQGHASAQFNQGLLYARGQGVAKDLVRAYMWLSLGIEELTGANRANALKARKGFQKLMTPTQVTEAKRLAREWVEKRRRM